MRGHGFEAVLRPYDSTHEREGHIRGFIGDDEANPTAVIDGITGFQKTAPFGDVAKETRLGPGGSGEEIPVGFEQNQVPDVLTRFQFSLPPRDRQSMLRAKSVDGGSAAISNLNDFRER